MEKMFATERRNTILDLLQQDKRITVKDLAKSLNVSEATLRTDLNIMEDQGLLTRTHGGAILNENTINPENSFSERSKKNKEYKMSITNKAIELINNQDCILLDASTTALELAKNLKNKQMNLTVVTNGISAAIELKENPNINVILIGGMVRVGSMALEGLLGTSILDKINVDIMFTSASGFSINEGLTDFNVYEVELKKVMVAKSNKVIALLDHTKLEKSSIASFAYTDEIDMIITDQNVSKELLTSLEEYNIDIATSKLPDNSQ